MKSGILFSIAFLTLFTSCKKENATAKVIQQPKTSIAKDGCYAYKLNGSKIELQLRYIANSDSITGTLDFAFAEKDSNKGTIKGKIANTVLIADYTFQSEGMESMRQVAFKLKDDKAILGYGEMTPDGTHFKDVAKVKFDSGIQLTRTDCTD